MSRRRKLISTHALREEGDRLSTTKVTGSRNFYPRPPRGGRRGKASQMLAHLGDFYPRPPRGGRRPFFGQKCNCSAISTHALREEGDRQLGYELARLLDFYPRPPRGGRQLRAKYRGVGGMISTHALREEGDRPTIFP